MSFLNYYNGRGIYPAMAQRQPAVIDLTQDDLDTDEAPATNEDTDGQDFTSEDDKMDDNTHSLGQEEEEEVSPYPVQRGRGFGLKSLFETGPPASNPRIGCTYYHRKSPILGEPAFVPHDDVTGESSAILKAATTVGQSGESLDANRDIELRDIPELRLRFLTRDVYQIVSKAKPNVTIKECRDALTSSVNWQVPKVVMLLTGLNNDATDYSSFKAPVQIQQASKSSSTSSAVASHDNQQELSDNDSDIPWEAFQSFLEIQRADFSSGKEFLQGCEKLRQKVLITWNLQFTQKFTQTLFINAMRSHDPVLANALRRAHLAGNLEFRGLKRIIRMEEITDHTMIGHQTWGHWKDELLSTTDTHEAI